MGATPFTVSCVATYGSPQSNGCVEMPIAEAAQVWPLTPIGTLVTVVGPPS